MPQKNDWHNPRLVVRSLPKSERLRHEDIWTWELRVDKGAGDLQTYHVPVAASVEHYRTSELASVAAREFSDNMLVDAVRLTVQAKPEKRLEGVFADGTPAPPPQPQ